MSLQLCQLQPALFVCNMLKCNFHYLQCCVHMKHFKAYTFSKIPIKVFLFLSYIIGYYNDQLGDLSIFHISVTDEQ